MKPIRGNNKSFNEVNRDLRRLEQALSSASDQSLDVVDINDLTVNNTLTIDALAGILKATAGLVSAVNPNFVVYPGPATSDLTNERVLTAGTNISFVDGGAGGAVTISAAGLGGSAEAYVTIGNTAGLSAERALTAGDGIDITDGGANSTVTILADLNTTNLQFTATEINTIQDIHTGASPTFVRATLSQATGTAPLTVSSTTKVANLNADLLDDQTGSYYLDSANFTGTNWTDLTDGGATTLHTHASGGITDFTEAVQDVVGTAFILGGNGIDDPTYDDVGNTLTIHADINTTNLQFTATEINTIQNINTAASPTFAGMTLTAFSGFVKATAGVLSAETIESTDVSDFTEAVQDVVGTNLDTNEGDGIDVTYDDVGNTIVIAADINATNLKFTAGEIDTIQSIATGASPTFNSITLTTFTGFTAANWIDLTDGGGTTLHTHTASGITDFVEVAQDSIGTILLDSTRINFTYDDATPTITADLIANTITAGYLSSSATDRLFGRDTAAAGAGEEITVGGGLEFTGSGGIQRSAFSGGDVTGSAGSATLTIANDAVTYAKMQNVAASRLLGRYTGSSGDCQEIAINTAQLSMTLGTLGIITHITPIAADSAALTGSAGEQFFNQQIQMDASWAAANEHWHVMFGGKYTVDADVGTTTQRFRMYHTRVASSTRTLLFDSGNLSVATSTTDVCFYIQGILRVDSVGAAGAMRFHGFCSNVRGQTADRTSITGDNDEANYLELSIEWAGSAADAQDSAVLESGSMTKMI